MYKGKVHYKKPCLKNYNYNVIKTKYGWIIFLTLPYFLRSYLYEGDAVEPIIDWSGISWNWEYNFYYYNLAKLVFWGIVPMVLLIYFNLKVYFGIESANNILNSEEKQKRRQQEKKMSIIMIIIVLVFILCHSLRTFNWCYVFMLLNTHKNCTHEIYDDNTDESLLVREFHTIWMHICWGISDVLIVFNSSVNMIIYCGVSEQFRQQLVLIFKRIAVKLRCIDPELMIQNITIPESRRMVSLW